MKLIFGLIKIVLIFAFIAGIFMLLINKTFIYETYQDDAMKGEGIPISRYMYYVGLSSNSTATFIAPLSQEYLDTYRNDYLKNLETCYGKYYYDANNEITVSSYNIVDNGLYRTVSINFINDNYCSDDYVLDDYWVEDYLNKSNYVSGDITSVLTKALITTVGSAKRIEEPIIDDDYESEISLSVTCSSAQKQYTLTFSDFAQDQLLVIKEEDSHKQFAVYEFGGVVNYLNSLAGN